MNAADWLVDAVIVWEALFGTRQGESALRISAAMAWLLADDSVEARTLLRGEIGKIYNEEAELCTVAPMTKRLPGPSHRALELARDALKRLIGSRPDLLATRDNADRSAKLLLGG